MRLAPLPLAIAVALVATATPLTASAQSGSWNFAAGISSDNRQRDTSKSDGEASTWGRATWNSANKGVYAMAAYETLDMGGSQLGLAAYTGLRHQVGPFDADFQISYKTVVDADAGYDDDTVEMKVDLTRTYGKTRTRLRAEYSPDGLGVTEQWTWVSAYAAYPLTRKLSASAEIGYRQQHNNVDYTGLNAGLTYAVTPHLGLDVRWHGTDADLPVATHKDRIVTGLTYSF